MAITPVEIRHIQLRKGIRGYRRPAVERLLADIAEDFEEVWRQRADLSDKVEQLESDLQRHRELEGLLRTTLVSAERSAQELKDQARREADNIVSEATARRAPSPGGPRPSASASIARFVGSSRSCARRSRRWTGPGPTGASRSASRPARSAG